MSLFEDDDFGGKSYAFEIGDHSCDVFTERGMNDKMTGIKVPEGLIATIYLDCFSGSKYELKGPFEASFITGFADNVSSMKVRPNKDNESYPVAEIW